mgnify:FL=1
MNIFKLVIRNIRNYGLKNIVLMTFYETVYSLNGKFRKQIFHDESITDSYQDISEKKINRFDGPYHPTPIYILKLINGELKKKNLKKYTFIDFGCGAGRSIYFFRKNFERKIGIDINNGYRKFFKDDIFLNLDIRKIKTLNDISKDMNNEHFVLYFYRPIEDESVKKIIESFMKKKIVVITINVENLGLNGLNVVYEKYFYDKKRNIIIYSN